MARVQTSVMIDEFKRDLAKQKGIKLQDVLDQALNSILELEVKGKAQLEIEKEKLLKDIELKEQQKNEYLEKYESDMMQLKMQLTNIDIQLEKAKEDQSQLNKLNEYKDIIRVASNYGGLNDEIEEQIFAWIGKWKVGNDVTGLFAQINKDLTNVCYRILTLDDITIDYPIFRGIYEDGGNE